MEGITQTEAKGSSSPSLPREGELINVLFACGFVILFDKTCFLVTRTTPTARRTIPRTIRTKRFPSLLFKEDVPDENSDYEQDGSNYDENFIPLHSFSPYAPIASASFCLFETMKPQETMRAARTKVMMSPSHHWKT